MTLEPISCIGDMEICKRSLPANSKRPRYVVFGADGRKLKEAARLASLLKWCKWVSDIKNFKEAYLGVNIIGGPPIR